MLLTDVLYVGMKLPWFSICRPYSDMSELSSNPSGTTSANLTFSVGDVACGSDTPTFRSDLYVGEFYSTAMTAGKPAKTHSLRCKDTLWAILQITERQRELLCFVVISVFALHLRCLVWVSAPRYCDGWVFVVPSCVLWRFDEISSAKPYRNISRSRDFDCSKQWNLTQLRFDFRWWGAKPLRH